MAHHYLPGSKTVFMTSAVLFVGFLGVLLKADSNLAATPGGTPGRRGEIRKRQN
jgi:hypothetical protein